MRISIFALFVSIGLTATGQSPGPGAVKPQPQWLLPPISIHPGASFDQAPREWHLNPDVPFNSIVLEPPQQKSAAPIDPQMVLHPPQSKVGEQAPGTLMAQNLYPGLQFLPIDGPNPGAREIPITWPERKLKNIPTDWPKYELKVVENGKKAARK
jgi:hypothetical protein